jgi:hypothetical protein
VYLRSQVGGPPWGSNTNEQALDLAFGAGNWDDLRYETVNTGVLFSPATTFIFMEGGDNNANDLEAFLGANQATLEAWVSGGGSVFLNAAPNEGDGMSYGFGGVTLNYDGTVFSNTGTAANAAHPIFNGPHVPAGPNYTGTFFSHGFVTGAGLTSLILASDASNVLASMVYGAGHAMFGSMTTTNFHDPDPNALNLRANILEFGADQGVAAIPEPATLSLMTLGLAAAAGHAWRRRRRDCNK